MSLVIREKQTKATVQYRDIPAQGQKLKTTVPSAGEDVGHLELSTRPVGEATGTNVLENRLPEPRKAKHPRAELPNNFTPGYSPNENQCLSSPKAIDNNVYSSFIHIIAPN